MSRCIMILKGVLITYILNIIFLLIYAAILAYTSVSESTIPTVIFVINLLGVFISTSLAAIKIKENGMKYGAIIAAAYITSLYLIGSLGGVGLKLSSYALATIIFNILIGIVGGIIGVNLVKN